MVNRERQKAGLQPLQWDDHLAAAAQQHTELLARHKDLSHQFSGEPPLDRRTGSAGARFNSVAENVGYAPTVERLHNGFMNSPPHRANILNSTYNAVGISIIARGDELYATQDFAQLIPSYSESQFENAVVAALQNTRKTHGLAPMTVRHDPRLKNAACSATLNARKVLEGLPGATDLAIYTSSDPSKLAPAMQQAAADRTLHRMNIGVCFKSGDKTGFSKYWVVAAFYPVE